MSSSEVIVSLHARCTVKADKTRPIKNRDRFNLYVHGEYFPSVVASVEGGPLQPGHTGEVHIRAVMRGNDVDLPRGTRIELREALNVFAVGELLSISADA